MIIDSQGLIIKVRSEQSVALASISDRWFPTRVRQNQWQRNGGKGMGASARMLGFSLASIPLPQSADSLGLPAAGGLALHFTHNSDSENRPTAPLERRFPNRRRTSGVPVLGGWKPPLLRAALCEPHLSSPNCGQSAGFASRSDGVPFSANSVSAILVVHHWRNEESSSAPTCQHPTGFFAALSMTK